MAGDAFEGRAKSNGKQKGKNERSALKGDRKKAYEFEWRGTPLKGSRAVERRRRDETKQRNEYRDSAREIG